MAGPIKLIKKKSFNRKVKSEKEKATRWPKGVSGAVVYKDQVLLTLAKKRATHRDLAEIANLIVSNDIEVLKKFVEQESGNALQYAFAKTFLQAAQRGDIYSLNAFIDRLVGRSQSDLNPENLYKDIPPQGKMSFGKFCEAVGYPIPYPKQIEMRFFAFREFVPRLLLGSRGYGKTDYLTILGTAYEIYCNPTEFTCLIVTKSDDRNKSILKEISEALKKVGMILDLDNATNLNVKGHTGDKDHSCSVKTLYSKGFRGHHPSLIILDDPVTEEDTSPAVRAKAQTVYNELHKLTSNILIIGQPVHRSDLYETLRPLLKKMEVPFGSIPELDPDLEAQKFAGVSEESISASYMLKVISEGVAPFESIQLVDHWPIEGDAVAFIDPSFEGSDYTALTCAKAHFDNVVCKGRVWKKAWNHCLDDIVKELELCGVRKVCIETNSLGDQPVLMVRDLMPEHYGIGVVGRKTLSNKHSRIMNAGSYAHRLRLVKTSDKKYLEHVRGYDYKAEFDDAPDSLASLLEWLGLIKGKTKKGN